MENSYEQLIALLHASGQQYVCLAASGVQNCLGGQFLFTDLPLPYCVSTWWCVSSRTTAEGVKDFILSVKREWMH